MLQGKRGRPLAPAVLLAAMMVPCALSFHVSPPVAGLRIGHRSSSQGFLPAGSCLGEPRSRPARQGQLVGGLKASMIPSLAPAVQVRTEPLSSPRSRPNVAILVPTNVCLTSGTFEEDVTFGTSAEPGQCSDKFVWRGCPRRSHCLSRSGPLPRGSIAGCRSI